MRKYSIPKFAYILVIVFVFCVSVGYTYAYFSSSHTATGNLDTHEVLVAWRNYDPDGTMQDWYDDPSTTVDESLSIQLTGELVRGGYCAINAVTYEGLALEVLLTMSNEGYEDAHCRIKITATYVDDEGNVVECEDGWIQLAININDNPTLITDTGDWVFEDGYYYYKRASTMKVLVAGDYLEVADHLYLSKDSNPVVYGKELTIIVALEAVQTEHDAYISLWK